MKHNIKITLLLITLFLISQVIGLAITNKYLQPSKELPLGIERPEITPQETFIQLIVAILFATLVALIIVRFKAVNVWRGWFFLSIFFTLTISFNAFFNQLVSILLALFIGFYKTFRKNTIINNIAELLIYGALSAIFVPLLNMLYVTIILFVISVYDAIAVWKTKHMISLAKFQTTSKIFAGFHIHYGKKKEAILGGGDIAFPLLFAGVVLKTMGVFSASIVVLCTTLALFTLFALGKKNTYYPAMPYLFSGSLIGTLIAILII